MNDLGRLLTLYRRRADLSMGQLARACAIDPSYVVKIENGTREPPRRPILHAFATALALSESERCHFFLVAFGEPAVASWVNEAIHATTVQTAKAILAGCPCEPCTARLRVVEATG